MEDCFSVAYQKSDNGKDLDYAFFGMFDGWVMSTSYQLLIKRYQAMLFCNIFWKPFFKTYCDKKNYLYRHGGDTASVFAKNHLMNYIVDQPGFWSTYDEDMLQAIKKGFLECHMAMWKDLGKTWRLFWIQCEKIERDFSFYPVASEKPSNF